jgi:flagellar biosynthesis protein FlhF
MHYRRYEAPSLNEALSKVRAELGPDALILSSRTLDPDGERPEGRGVRLVEVTAATERINSRNTPVVRPPAEIRAVPAGSRTPATTKKNSLVQNTPSSQAANRLFDLGVYGFNMSLVLSQLGFDPVMLDLFSKLDGQGVDSRISLSLLEKVRSVVERAGKSGDPRMVLKVFRRFLQEKVQKMVPDPKWNDGPTVMCMVGPTGVGKTTTVAKLAALYGLEQNKRLVLATLDTYRIAAAEQLKVYARVMGLPLQVIHNGEHIDQLLKDHHDADVILIDTAGRSPNSDEHLQDLRKSLAGNPRLFNYLHVSAGLQEADLVRVVERFSTVDLKGLIFTKLDECTRFGGMFNLMYRTSLPLAYFTTGQKVPDDLEPADVDGVLSRIFGAAA